MKEKCSSTVRFILIHGAWAASWVWEGLEKALVAKGWLVDALDLPGDGSHRISAEETEESDFYECIKAAIDSGPKPVILVGHSGGGMLVTKGLEYEGAIGGIYIAGFCIPDGRSFDNIQEAVLGPGQRFGVTPHVIPSADGRTTTVPVQAAVKFFFQDAPPDIARKAANRLTPQPNSGSRIATVAGPRFFEVPKLYILALRDKSVLPEAQFLMCRDVANLTIREIESDHAPQLTRSPELVSIIEEWLCNKLSML